MTKLQKASGNEELFHLRDTYKHKEKVNNLYLMNEWLQSSKAYQTILFCDMGDGMAAFKDEGDFYRVVFALSDGVLFRFPTLDKDLCCDLVEIGGKTDPKETYGEQLLLSNGFAIVDHQEQMRFCCGELHQQAVEMKETYLRQLQTLQLRYTCAGLSEFKKIKQLVHKELGRYDAIDLDDNGMLEEAQKGNIICFAGKDKIAAAYFFKPYAGRIVVEPEYRGQHLSKMLRMLFIAQERWHDSKENQYDWVRMGNEPSRRCLLSVGAVSTGKEKKRFVKLCST